jgi:hypothetical protein
LERKEEKEKKAAGECKKEGKEVGERMKKAKLSRFQKFSAPSSMKADTERGLR